MNCSAAFRYQTSANRRSFLKFAAASSVVGALPKPLGLFAADDQPPQMKLGLVTYLWGQHMDLPTLIDACERSGFEGLELRTEHRHGVEPELSATQRAEVRRRFDDSPVTLVGYGSNAQFHENDPEKVRQNIELTKQYIHLMHDCGASGVKVKPNGFVSGVPRERTIEQIGRALNEVGRYGADYRQQIRVEVHGSGTSELPVMQAILEVADHPNVTVCWNSNGEDLKGDGLEANFNRVRDRFGDTVHVRELNGGDYPYEQLMELFVEMKYGGWILLEARTDPADKIAAMKEQREIFDRMIS